MDFSELSFVKHVLGPEAADRVPPFALRSQARRKRAPIWLAPLVVVFILYGITFAVSVLVSNDANRSYAMREEAPLVERAP